MSENQTETAVAAPVLGTLNHTISVKLDEANTKAVAVSKQIADHAKDAMNRYSAELVFDYFMQTVKTKLNAVVTRCIKAGMDDDKIAEIIANWKPGDSIALERSARDPLAGVKKAAANMTPEEKLELAKSLGLIS